MADSKTAPTLVNESKKRRREIMIAAFVGTLLILLTWLEVKLFSISEQLPFEHSIFFFGLVNFNIILLLFLLFLVFRNLVKVYVERRSRIFGSSLKSKLVVSFTVFSFVPTVLIFLISVFYINSSFDKWFNVKTSSVLKGALEVTQNYYFNSTKRNYHFAHLVAGKIGEGALDSLSTKALASRLQSWRTEYSLDVVEYYPSRSERVLAQAKEESLPEIPKPSLEFLRKGLVGGVEASTIHNFADGNLVRVIVAVPNRVGAAVVVSSYLPLSLTSKIDDISEVYKEFREANPLQYPLRSIYLIILVLMTCVILLAATWIGFHLARQLSTPLVQLGRATRRIAGGDYTPVDITSGSEEINSLVDSFNQMTVNLASSEREIKAINSNLQETLLNLDQHSRYIEIVLGNVSAGVISVDKDGKLVTINAKACDLLKIEGEKFVGRSVRELLTLDQFRMFTDLVKEMNVNQVSKLQREVTVPIHGEPVPLHITLSLLKNEKGVELGKIVVFDDLTALQNAQRAQAWTEVARRIAHEIKNPLTPIRLSAERLARKFQSQIPDPAFLECTQMIVQQTEDLKNLVNEFTQFARLPESRPIVGDFHETLDEAISIYRNAHPGIEFSCQYFPNLAPFRFDPQQMKRAVVNILDNSVFAMKTVSHPRIQIQTSFDRELKTLKLTVEDNGLGIPAEMRSRIFDPYVSTKSEGTGLGLAIVRRIVEDHSGFIRALPVAPTGTKMVIEIPAQPAQNAIV